MPEFPTKIAIILILLLRITLGTIAQSCCSGGVPISNNLGLPLSEAKTWQFALSYDLNILKTLQDGSVKLEDDARERRTHSFLFQTGYVFNDRWSSEVFLSLIRQERIITQFGNTDITTAQGLGDAVFLLKYKIISNKVKKITWTIGAGPKLPTGPSDRKDEDGIALNADLQPGSGSLDLITWTQFSKSSNKRPSLNYTGSATVSIKGKNNNYLGSQVYQFGNELILIAGLSDLFTANRFLWGASLEGMFRLAGQDENDGEKTPGTGGKWFFIRPALSIKPSTSSSINVSTTIPVYSYVLDTQLTPTIRFNVGVYYEIGPKRAYQTLNK
jgi:hypothetical protein